MNIAYEYLGTHFENHSLHVTYVCLSSKRLQLTQVRIIGLVANSMRLSAARRSKQFFLRLDIWF